MTASKLLTATVYFLQKQASLLARFSFSSWVHIFVFVMSRDSAVSEVEDNNGFLYKHHLQALAFKKHLLFKMQKAFVFRKVNALYLPASLPLSPHPLNSYSYLDDKLFLMPGDEKIGGRNGWA